MCIPIQKDSPVVTARTRPVVDTGTSIDAAPKRAVLTSNLPDGPPGSGCGFYAGVVQPPRPQSTRPIGTMRSTREHGIEPDFAGGRCHAVRRRPPRTHRILKSRPGGQHEPGHIPRNFTTGSGPVFPPGPSEGLGVPDPTGSTPPDPLAAAPIGGERGTITGGPSVYPPVRAGGKGGDRDAESVHGRRGARGTFP